MGERDDLCIKSDLVHELNHPMKRTIQYKNLTMIEGLSTTTTNLISLYHGLQNKMKVVSNFEYKEARPYVCVSTDISLEKAR